MFQSDDLVVKQNLIKDKLVDKGAGNNRRELKGAVDVLNKLLVSNCFESVVRGRVSFNKYRELGADSLHHRFHVSHLSDL